MSSSGFSVGNTTGMGDRATAKEQPISEVIREMGPSDVERVVALARRCPVGTELAFRGEPPPGVLHTVRGEAATLVYEMEGQVVGSASFSLDWTRVGGSPTRCALTYGLRVDPQYRRKGIAGRLSEAMNDYVQNRGAALLKVFVAPDNVSRFTLIGRGYTRVADRMVWGIPVLWPRATRQNAAIRRFKHTDLAPLVGLMNRFHADYDFFQPWDADRCEAEMARIPGFDLESVLVAERGGQLTACLGVWDYSQYMKTFVVRLSGSLRALRWAADPISRALRRAGVPGPGEEIRQYVIFPLAYTHPGDVKDLFDRIYNRALAEGVPLITVPVAAGEDLPFLPRRLKVGFRSNMFVMPMVQGANASFGRIYMSPLEWL